MIKQTKRTVITVLALFFLCFPMFSQQNRSSIHFENLLHNFGLINEADGIQFHDFVFTNKGEDILIVTNVKAGGGVSVVRWSRNPVMPGDSGTISIEFNPQNMPGKFNRVIAVNATGSPSSLQLRLLGDVIGREKTTEELYPHEIGLLRIRSNHIFFGNVTPGSVRSDSTGIINLSGEDLTLTFTGIPRHVTLEAVPSRLKPGEEGVVVVLYDAGKINEWGVNTHNCRILVNDLSHGRNIIYISANIQEDFSKLSDEDKEKAPVISFENRVFDFGKIKHGESIEHEFVFSNTGRSDLVIRRVRAGCGCTAVEPQKTLLKPGESSNIKTIFNSRGFNGKQNKGITIISNDPSNSSILLRVTGEVISE